MLSGADEDFNEPAEFEESHDEPTNMTEEVSKEDDNDLTPLSPVFVQPINPDHLDEVNLADDKGPSLGNHSVVVPPPLPPRQAASPANSRKSPFAWLKSGQSGKSRSTELVPPLPARPADIDIIPNYELLLSRMDATRENVQNKESSERESYSAGMQKLKESFEKLRQEKQNVAGYGVESEDDMAAINWGMTVLLC